MTKSSADSLQTVAAVVGVSLGVIPLIRLAVTGHLGGLLSWVPGTGSSLGRWLVPAVVTVVCLTVIALLEQAKEG